MKVLLPGSYDPVTLGHLDIIERVHKRGDEVYAVAFVNSEKSYLFTPEERVLMLRLATEHLDSVTVDFSSGRVVDYMKEKGIELIVKGYRNGSDLAYETVQADYNLKNGGYRTEFIKSSDSLSGISSTKAREAILNKDELSGLLPQKVIDFLSSKD